MQEAEPETAEETIAYALGRTKPGVMNDLRAGTHEKKSAARRLVARRIIEHLRLCGYAIIRVRPPLQSHSIGTGFKPEETGLPPTKPKLPD